MTTPVGALVVHLCRRRCAPLERKLGAKEMDRTRRNFITGDKGEVAVIIIQNEALRRWRPPAITFQGIVHLLL